MILSLLIFLALIFPHTVAATDANLISVSPSIVRLDLQTDKPEAILTYHNNSSQTIEIALSASDFDELENGYKPSFLEGKNATNYKYSLSSWIDFDKKTIVLTPQSSEQVTFTIKPNQLTPGGHYASILAKMSHETTDEVVQIQGSLASLLFVRTATGQEKDDGKIQAFAPASKWLEFPKSFVLRFQNTGNTDVIPYGLVTITDMFGRIVAKGILNEGSLVTLPESIRRYDSEIKHDSMLLLPGMYTADFTGHFGASNKKMATKIQFFSEGSIPLLPLLVIVGVVLIVLWTKRKRNRYPRPFALAQ